MPIGAPGTDSFADAIIKFRNGAIHTYVGVCIRFRQQLLIEGAFGTQSGWDNATQKFTLTWLLFLDTVRRKITYNPNPETLANLIDKAVALGIDITAIEAANPTAPGGDEVARPSAHERVLTYALDGTDPNIPSLSAVNFRNTTARGLVGMLDAHIVEATRLDSRNASRRITPYESTMLYGGLAEMVDLVLTFGGDNARLPIPNGVLPSEEPRGANVATNLDLAKPKSA